MRNRKDYESTAKLVFLQTIGPQLNALGLIPQSADADNLAREQRCSWSARGGWQRPRARRAPEAAGSTSRSTTSQTM